MRNRSGIPAGYRTRWRHWLAALLLLNTLATGSAIAETVVSGQVVDLATQQPIANADIVIYFTGAFGWPMPLRYATAGADGRYSVEVPDINLISAVARASGYAARTQTGAPCAESDACNFGSFVPLPEGSATFDFALSRAARLTGFVHDAQTGEAVITAGVQLVSTTSTQIFHNATVDATGRFTVSGVHAGNYRLVAWGDIANPTGYARRYLRFRWPDNHCDDVQVRCDSAAPGQVAFAADQTLDLDLPLRRGSYLRTRVVSDGNGQPTFIHAASARILAQPSNGVGGSDGDYEGYTWVGPLLPGPLHLVLDSPYPDAYADVIYPDRACPASGCDFSGAPVYEVPATDGIHTLADVHVQPLRTIRGRVTSAVDGLPIAGLRVDAGNLHAPLGPPWGFQPTASTQTDSNGEYTLEGFDGSEVMVRTRQNGLGWLDQAWQNEDCDAMNLFCQRDTQHLPLAFAANSHPAGIDFVLGRGASLRGRVVEEGTNRPLRRYAVAVVPLAVQRIGKPVLTDADGQFRIDGLTPDSYYLFASPTPVYGAVDGIMHPGGPCTFSLLNNGANSCFPTTHAPLEPAAGGVIDGQTIVMPRTEALFRDGFEG